MAKDEGIIEAFTGLAPRYEEVVDGELRRFWGWSYAEFVARLIAEVPIGEGDVILDVATGTSVIPRALVGRAGPIANLVGLDITLSMLQRGQQFLADQEECACIRLVCASALAMPFREASFDAVICALATHHMDVERLLAEIGRVLRRGGRLVVADVAASPAWKLPGVKALLRVATLLYFLPRRNVARAWAEADAVYNVRTAQEWAKLLTDAGFEALRITALPKNHFHVPAPLVMRSIKS